MEAVKKMQGLSDITLFNLEGYLKNKGITKAAFAESISLSRPTLSKAMSGTYTSDITDIENTIKDYLKEQGAYADIIPVNKSHASERPTFYKTRDAAEIIGICKACQERRGLGIIVGRSGFGKTYTLKQYAQLNKVCYIECDDTMSTKDLVEAIQIQLGIPSSYGSVWKRVSGIKDFFNINEGYVLIIDEADKLISKYTQKKLELLRAIFDQCNVGVVIAGEPRLETLVKSYLNRFANRIDFYSNLKGLSKDEVKNYLSYYNIADSAVTELTSRATGFQTACFRLLDRTLKNIFRIINEDDEITLDVIKKASAMMML